MVILEKCGGAHQSCEACRGGIEQAWSTKSRLEMGSNEKCPTWTGLKRHPERLLPGITEHAFVGPCQYARHVPDKQRSEDSHCWNGFTQDKRASVFKAESSLAHDQHARTKAILLTKSAMLYITFK